MPRGDKSKYTDKQKRKAEHIEEGYEDAAFPKRKPAARLGDGEQGVGRRQQVGQRPGRAGHPRLQQEGRPEGGAASAARPKAARAASAKKAAATRKRRGH